MTKPLLDVLFMSEKRKGVLLLLKDGSKEMEYLLNALDTTRTALLPQVRVLEEHYLIRHSKDNYELTTIGKLIVDKMAPLLNTCKTFGSDIDYWGTRNLELIPPDLLSRISELGDCQVVVPHVTEMYEINRKFSEATKRSKSHFVITTFIHPSIAVLLPELFSNKVNLNIIVSPDLINKMHDCSNNFIGPIQKELVNVFVFPKKMGFQIVSCNDYYLMLSLLKDDGEIDNKYLLCSGPDAIEWGKHLFQCYLKESTPVTKIC